MSKIRISSLTLFSCTSIYFFTLRTCYAQLNTSHFKIKKLRNTNIVRGYSYTLHNATDKYLLYVQNQTDIVYLYDIKKEKIVFKKKIPKGKGPEELTMINSAAYLNNKIYLGCAPQAKILE